VEEEAIRQYLFVSFKIFQKLQLIVIIEITHQNRTVI